jgi:hypothetical protein
MLDLAQRGDGTFEISRVPQDDRGDEQVEAGGAVLLVLVGAIADLAQPVDEDRASQTVTSLTVVQFPPGHAEGTASVVMQTTLWMNRPGTPPVSEPWWTVLGREMVAGHILWTDLDVFEVSSSSPSRDGRLMDISSKIWILNVFPLALSA